MTSQYVCCTWCRRWFVIRGPEPDLRVISLPGLNRLSNFDTFIIESKNDSIWIRLIDWGVESVEPPTLHRNIQTWLPVCCMDYSNMAACLLHGLFQHGCLSVAWIIPTWLPEGRSSIASIVYRCDDVSANTYTVATLFLRNCDYFLPKEEMN